MKPIEVETMEDVGKILTRFQRKLRKVVVGLAPAVPIYAYCLEVPPDGTLLRYMFPVQGRILKVMVRVVGAKTDKPILIRVELMGSPKGQYAEFVLKRELTSLLLDFPVEEGDRLIVSTPETSFAGIELSALFVSSVRVGDVHKVMVEELEKLPGVEEEAKDEGV